MVCHSRGAAASGRGLATILSGIGSSRIDVKHWQGATTSGGCWVVGGLDCDRFRSVTCDIDRSGPVPRAWVFGRWRARGRHGLDLRLTPVRALRGDCWRRSYRGVGFRIGAVKHAIMATFPDRCLEFAPYRKPSLQRVLKSDGRGRRSRHSVQSGTPGLCWIGFCFLRKHVSS